MANYDRDGSGHVSLPDLKYLLTNCGLFFLYLKFYIWNLGEPLSEEEAEILLHLHDNNNKGNVNINEFIRLITS